MVANAPLLWYNISAMKQCTSCKQIKELSAFSSHKGKKDGLSSNCAACNVERNRKWRNANREKTRKQCREYVARWRAKNPDKSREIIKRQRDKRYRHPAARLNRAISSRISRLLHRQKETFGYWQELTGYSLDQLKAHLEKQFDSKMTWENYGSYWHVDHKIPVTAFNFEHAEDIDFKRCWALKNLQPLEAKRNISKGNVLERPFQPSLTM